MEFEGIVFRKMPEVTGTSSRGAWKKQDVVFELSGEFSRKICVTFFGDRADDAAALQEGDAVQVSVNVESREYNGKWYTDVKAWKIARKTAEGGSGSGGSGYSRASGSGGSGYSGASGSGSGGSGYSGASGYGSAGDQGYGASGSGNQGSDSRSHGTSSSAGSPFGDAPFNESTAPSPADEVDDLPF